MNEEDLRDCFAMFSMLGLVLMNREPFDDQAVAELSYKLADHMLIARTKKYWTGEKDEEDAGITAVVPKRTRKR